ncbi:hypothetical protein [Streptacidiphilus monticola]|uniref:TrbL/VirB6 plasmid conjugal transfer protein n=1 Tax=Streptacidiphilus monticola TaxID=2161674 RepID=A0ABW1FVY7_9ACTN
MKGLLWAPRPGIASRDTVRRAATLTGTLAVFVLTTAQVACAATASSSTGSRAGGGGGAGILGPFNVTSSEGVPLDHYDLVSNSGGLTDFQQEAQSYLMSMLWALSRTLVGLECWLIHWAYSFPLVTAVSTQAQQLADGYRTYVVDALGLPGLLLAWAVVVGGIMLLRGRAGRALGELLLTFVIAGVAASALVRPDVILGPGGLLDQTKQASTEVAAITANHGTPPSTVAAADAGQVSAPIQHTLTDVFVVQTWQLLEFGHPLTPKDPDWTAYRQAVTLGPPYSQDSESQTDDCAGLTGTGLDLCRAQATASGDGKPEDNLAHLFAKDQATAAYLKTPSWDRVLGALLVLVAVAVVGLLIAAMCLVLFAAQFADAALAACSYPVLVWAQLPGPNRGVLWRWCGSFVASALAMAASTVFIPLFGAAVTAFLQGSTDGLVAKLVLIDLLAVAALGFHRRLLTLASSAGSRMANRLRWARIGGTGTGDDATRTGQVIATALGMSTPAGYNSGYQGLGLGGIAAFGLAGPGGGGEASGPQAHLLRRARLLAHARAVGDVPGAVLHPGRLAGDAVRHGRHALAPATLVLRGAEHAWKGKPLSPAEWERRTIKPGMGGRLPVGSRLHNRLLHTRGGRTLLASSRLAWGATLGAPATWTRTRRRAQGLRREVRGQAQHYRLEAANYWHTEWKPGARDLTAPVRVTGKAAAAGAARAKIAADVHLAPAVEKAESAVRDAAVAATLATTPSQSTGGPVVRTPRTAGAPATPRDLARDRILHTLYEAQRKARGQDSGSGSAG